VVVVVVVVVVVLVVVVVVITANQIIFFPVRVSSVGTDILCYVSWTLLHHIRNCGITINSPMHFFSNANGSLVQEVRLKSIDTQPLFKPYLRPLRFGRKLKMIFPIINKGLA